MGPVSELALVLASLLTLVKPVVQWVPGSLPGTNVTGVLMFSEYAEPFFFCLIFAPSIRSYHQVSLATRIALPPTIFTYYAALRGRDAAAHVDDSSIRQRRGLFWSSGSLISPGLHKYVNDDFP